MIQKFLQDENGQGMVEYGLIIAVVALVVVAGLKLLGGGLNTTFGEIDKNLKGATNSAA